jgi:hypothetical protein
MFSVNNENRNNNLISMAKMKCAAKISMKAKKAAKAEKAKKSWLKIEDKRRNMK